MRKAVSILSATAIAIGTAIPAFAIDVPAPGEQSGSGATTLKLLTDTSEYGGTEIAEGQPGYNPASDPNDPTSPGVNLAFTVPSALNFVVKANGDLMCPSAAASYIQNESAYGIHVSSVKVDAETGWNIVSDASASGVTASNAVSMNVGPAMYSAVKVNLASALASKLTFSENIDKWGMSAKGDAADKLNLALDGKAKNISATLSSATDFATIHWYLTSGGTGTVYVEPLPSLTTMRADSAALRSTETSAADKTALINKYRPNAEAGTRINVVIGNGSGGTKNASVRLVDVNTDKGLVFMFSTSPFAFSLPMNDTMTNAGAWNASAMRTALNSDSTYTRFLQGLKIDDVAVTPARVTNYSLDYNGGTPQVLSTDTNNNGPADDGDLFWLPSQIEVYGEYSSLVTNYHGNENCTQFAYFNKLGVTTSSNRDVLTSISSSYWWLRSAYPDRDLQFMSVSNSGSSTPSAANDDSAIVPCFAL